MNEHSIFLAALDITDPGQRAEYLTRATGGDAALRQQVDALIAAHQRSGEFLDVPALRQMSGGSPDLASPTKPGEIDLSFLQPSTKPGSLGRLAHYEIEEVIGSGGCGIVLKAFDERLARIVAIKVMAPELAATSPARKRFLREARAAAAIRHENVISIHAVEDLPIPFLVMEHIAGPTLQEKLDETGPLDVREVLQIGQQIASGLAAAHSLGLIHRDIKPANVLLERGCSRIKITDFGLARSADDASVTQSGVIAGTPLYMSPEQAQGTAIDQRSDLFSLGSVLYVMSSGRPPFRAATTLAVLQRVAEDQPRPIQEIIPETPAWLVAIIAKLHAKQPGDRYASAQELADVLARCLAELQQKGRVEFLDDALAPASNATKPAPPPTEYVELPKARSGEKSAPARRPARDPLRWLPAAAAITILLLAGLALTEAGGVTHLGGTVVHLFSPGGTLVVEVDDPQVSVTIDGEEMVITGTGAKEIRLKPGQYTVLASKDGKIVRQELVTVARNGRQVVRVSREETPETAMVVPAQASAPVVLTAQHRKALQWVLSIGGRLALVVDGKQATYVFGDRLPEQPFTVQVVNLSVTKGVDDVSVENLKGIPDVNWIVFFGPPVGDATLAKAATYPGIARTPVLNLTDTLTTDAGLATLKRFPRLGDLHLTRTAVTSKGLADLRDLKLKQLVLSNCENIDDDAAAVLATLPVLERLYLDSNPITDAALARLAGCERLAMLNVRQCKVTEDGVKRLALALPACQIVWDGGVIGPTLAADPDRRAAEWVLSIGGDVRVLASGVESPIAKNGKLPDGPFHVTHVSLEGIRIVDAALLHLKELAHLKSLNIGHFFGNKNLTDAGIEHLLGLKQLEELNAIGARITDAGLQRLTTLKKLQVLHLGKTLVTNDGLRHLQELPALRIVSLTFMPISDDGLSHLESLTNLEALFLGEAAVTDDGLQHLQSLKKLDSLTLGGTKISGAGLVHLKGLPQLRTLSLEYSTVTDAGLEHLKDFRGLTTLQLRKTKVSAAGVKDLATALPNCRIVWDGGVIEPAQAFPLPKTAPAPSAALEALSREQIPPAALAFAGGGDPAKAPPSLVAVLGEPEPIHTAAISSIAFSADGRWVATAAGGDNSILLREAATGKVRRVLRGHTWTVRFVAFRPDSVTLVSGSADETVKVWSTEKEDEPTTLPLGVKAEMIAVSPDGRFLAAVSRGEVRLWAWGAWDKPTVLPAIEGGKPAALAFSADGETLACGWRVEKSDSPISLYITDDGTLKETLHGHPANIASVAISPDGEFLASAQGGKTRLWDLATGQVVRELDEALRVCFSPDSRRLVLGGHGGFRVCETNSGKEVEAARRPVTWGGIGALAFSHDGKTLGVADSSAAARFYDTTTWKPQAALSEPGHGCPVDALAVSPDGRKVLTRGRDHALRQWLIDGPNEQTIVHEYEKVDRLLAYSPDGQTFVTAESPPLTVWDAATKQPLATIPVTLYSLAYSPDGKLIAGNGIGDDMVYLCDVRLGQVVHRFPSIKEQAFSVAFSRDSSLVATAGNKGRVAVWNVATGAEAASWTTTPMRSIAFHPDGSLATGHHDGTIAFWEAASWQRQRTCHAHSGAVHRLRFTPDGRTLVSSGVDGAIQVRSPEHERARTVIPVGFAGVPVTFDLDASGQYLFASGPTSVICVHRLPVEDE